MPSLRHIFFILIAIAAPFLTWPYAISWMHHGGNIMSATAFFGDPIHMGGTAAFLSIDMLITWIVFMVWVVGDTRKIGLGLLWGCFFVFLSFIAVSMTFPIYLVVRERHLAGENPGWLASI